jgi:BirA family biotin operon repressor/biotin-[acetyl-CoA-carboxylase] ligase
MKGQILKILKTKAGIVSGQALSDKLGISRVAIWKHIQKLQALGYDILATTKGYRLDNSPDVPYPWEFPGRESKIFYYPELPSTMDAAKDLARKDCPHFTTVIAGRQISGRGRLQREWLSEKGGLYFTMVLRPDLPPVLSFRVSFLASLTLAGILHEVFGIDARVKWPNDILVDERKIAGMVSKKDLLSRYLDAFEHRMQTTAFDGIIAEWKQYTVTLNRDVRVVTTHEVLAGKAVDVDDTGALILKCADGSLKKILYGDCFHEN